MIRGVLLSLLLLCFVSFASASVDVHNFSLQSHFSFEESLKGEINLTVEDVDFTAIIRSSSGQEISLGDFLIANGVSPTCKPVSCGNDYEAGTFSTSKDFIIGTGEEVYGGFSIEGEDVHITSVNFDVQSDFVEGNNLPLAIDFFEGSDWNFNEFSNIFSNRYWGCYDNEAAAMGPLIRSSSYCEMITLLESGAYFVGAKVNRDDSKDLRMTVYSGDSGSPVGECLFNPVTEDGCRIDAEEEEVFDADAYQVCVSSEDPEDPDTYTDYRLYTESTGEVCGFVYAEGPLNSTADYQIFGRVAKYGDALLIESASFDFEALTTAADSLIEENYDRDCSDECILPFSLSGIAQTVTVSDVSLDYVKAGGDYVSDKVFPVSVSPASVDFSGILDLELTGFNVSEDGEYSLFLDDDLIIKDTLTLTAAPLLTSLSPSNPPAGIPITFFLGVDSSTNSSLTYVWDFGNGTVETTSENRIVHTFPELRNYTVSVKVSAPGNLSSKKDFYVETITPGVAVNVTLLKKKEVLESVSQAVSTFPDWYGDELSDLVELQIFIDEINRLEAARDKAYEDSKIVEIAKELYDLIVPSRVFIEETVTSPLLGGITDIKPSVIDYFAGGAGGEDLEDYKNPILRWQSENIEAIISTEKISSSWWNGEVRDAIRTYNVNVKSADYGETYFVINLPIEEIYFKDFAGAKRAEDSAIIPMNENEEVSFEFYVIGGEEVSFFASPRLSQLILEGTIDDTCNRNKICEKSNGETYKNCRTDCKPVGRAIFYIFLVIFLVFILYLFLQMWYKRRYENFLFEDRRQLYNLLMYISNARARKRSDTQIEEDLKKQGWSSERIEYVMKKSRGERTGMYEIIPIEKVVAYVRNFKARRLTNKAQGQIVRNIATQSRQQRGRNINKSGVQGRRIR
jgi:PKD repeat protein